MSLRSPSVPPVAHPSARHRPRADERRREAYNRCDREEATVLRLPFVLHAANELLAFLLELVMLLALGWWGAKSGTTRAGAVLLGVAAPLAVAVVWGLFAAPKARIRLPVPGILAVKALAFGSAAFAIYALGFPAAAGVFAVVSLANATLAAFDRDAAMRAKHG